MQSATSTNINSYSNSFIADDLTLKNISRWDYTKYLNIWVIRSIDNGSTQGYSFYPWDPLNASGHDGVVLEYRSFGTIGNVSAPWNLGGVAAHEIGHWLGLYHTFEPDPFGDMSCNNNDCSQDGDKVCDTPPEFYAASGCPTNQNSCHTDVNNGSPFTSDVNDPTDNYMDYADDACINTFTQGQKDRMYYNILTYRLQNHLNCCNTFLAISTLNNQVFNYGQNVNEGLGGVIDIINNGHLYVNAN